MTYRSLPQLALACSVTLAAVAASGVAGLSCSDDSSASSSQSTASGAGGQGAGGAPDAGGTPGAGGAGAQPGDTVHADFPAAPLVEEGLPTDLPALFAAATPGDSGGPCLTEPALDAMIPRNWTPLYFEWSPPAEQNVFEIRLKVENQSNELVAYTAQPSFQLDAAVWTALAEHSGGRDVEVTLRGARLENGALTQGPLLGASGALHIAPVAAPGSIVYWTSSNGTSFEGFTVGDPAPVTVLTPQSAGDASTGGATECVSCHVSSPDGKLVMYTRDTASGRAIDVRQVIGGPPPAEVVSPSALALLGRSRQAAPVMSAAHFSATDAVAISVFLGAETAQRDELVWTDLHATDATGWGIVQRSGDPRGVTSPAWRHDGTAIAYVSADSAVEGVIAGAPAGGVFDIYTVPYNDRAGGEAKPLPGASDPAYREFYPIYSPDDTLLAFNRTDQLVTSYNQPTAEVFVVPGAGGEPVRLRANDPPACTGYTSPGLTNSWARWAPTALRDGDLRYYWLVFSSKRRAVGPVLPQLYVAAIVTRVQGGAEVIEKDYPAIYVRSQSPGTANHTPAWDVFEVDDIPR